MATETALPTVASTESDDGGVAWSNFNNAKAEDDVFTTSLLDPFGVPFSERLKVITFNWSSMQDADTLTALQLNIKRKASANGECSDFHIFFIKNGTISGNDMADVGGTTYTTTNTFANYDVLSLSGLTLSCADLRASTTGLYFVAQALLFSARTVSVDVISLTATYTPAAGGATSHNLTLLGVGA